MRDCHLGRCMSATVALKCVQPTCLVLTLLTFVLIPTLTKQTDLIMKTQKCEHICKYMHA